MRDTDEQFQMPPGFKDRKGKLIYLSLGSLGSADVGLMSRMIGLLAETPHRVIVSKGEQHELIKLTDNMHGALFLPQTSIIPQVDL